MPAVQQPIDISWPPPPPPAANPKQPHANDGTDGRPTVA